MSLDLIGSIGRVERSKRRPKINRHMSLPAARLVMAWHGGEAVNVTGTMLEPRNPTAKCSSVTVTVFQ